MMNCEQSIELLSDYHDGDLIETIRVEISVHLADCPPCYGLYSDLDNIVVVASALRIEHGGISFPDQEVLWQRMELTFREIH